MTSLNKKALLIVDRGSREPDVKSELQKICHMVKSLGRYYFCSYCFLEVVPPFIEEGIEQCIDNGAESITIMPYFLYPGMKLKDSVTKIAKICATSVLKMAVAKPLTYHFRMAEIAINRINETKKENKIEAPDSDCDVILIGHGSSDKNSRPAFEYIANYLKAYYRNVQYCFLELDHPNIEEGFTIALQKSPNTILVMPYFLHRGAHVKCDIINDVSAALEKHRFKNAFMAEHLGVDEKLVELLVERASEVERRAGIS